MIPNKMECKECGKMFANNWNLKVHMETHNRTTQTQCPICDIRLTSGERYFLKHLELHENRHRGLPKSKKESVKCSICDKTVLYIKIHSPLWPASRAFFDLIENG